jgi:hypothetical protein
MRNDSRDAIISALSGCARLRSRRSSIVMARKGGSGRTFAFLAGDGQLAFPETRLEDPDFEFEMSGQDQFGMMAGKASGMVLAAAGNMKTAKDKWTDVAKIAGMPGTLPKTGGETTSRQTVRL